MFKRLGIGLFFLFSMPLNAMEQQHQHGAAKGLDLPEDIQQLLQQEMKQVKLGMESLVNAVASADWHAIRETGKKIKHSYIMKQKLSRHQMHQLHEQLPEEFQQIDAKFHYYAGMLSHVARERDIELVHYFIYKMNESCTSCHSKFAKEKFPGFGEHNKHADH